MKVGNNLEFPLGSLKYHKDTFVLPLFAIIAIAAGGAFFLFVILSICIVYQRKSKEAERKIRKMLIQLDTLESNVRNECKQGKVIKIRKNKRNELFDLQVNLQ